MGSDADYIRENWGESYVNGEFNIKDQSDESEEYPSIMPPGSAGRVGNCDFFVPSEEEILEEAYDLVYCDSLKQVKEYCMEKPDTSFIKTTHHASGFYISKPKHVSTEQMNEFYALFTKKRVYNEKGQLVYEAPTPKIKNGILAIE